MAHSGNAETGGKAGRWYVYQEKKVKGNNKGGKIEERLRDDVTADGRYVWAIRLNDAISAYCSARSTVKGDVSTLRDGADVETGSVAEDDDGGEFVVDDGRNSDSDDDDEGGDQDDSASRPPKRKRSASVVSGAGSSTTKLVPSAAIVVGAEATSQREFRAMIVKKMEDSAKAQVKLMSFVERLFSAPSTTTAPTATTAPPPGPAPMCHSCAAQPVGWNAAKGRYYQHCSDCM